MLLDRIQLRCKFQLDADLTVSSGQVKSGRSKGEEDLATLELLRDANDRPVIPATSLKGALRAAFSVSGTAEDERALFGAVSFGASGNAGRLALFAATPGEDAGTCEVYSSHTTIDRSSGAAARNRLFRVESVKAGTVFELDMHLAMDVGGDTAKLANDIALLGRALAPWREGLRLGKGGRRGEGLTHLLPLEEGAAVLHVFDPKKGYPDLRQGARDVSAALNAAMEKALVDLPRQDAAHVARVSLSAARPFLIVDGEGAQRRDETTQVPALRDSSGAAVLPATSVLGALRGRAAWLCEIARMRGTDPGWLPENRAADCPADDRDLDKALSGRRAVGDLEDLAGLSSVERLFGVAGWRGMLRISGFKRVSPGHKTELANVAIDRFSGGALRGALFHTDATTGCAWSFDLTLDEVRREASDLDRTFLTHLLDDLEKNGLSLGHAAARGLGRFDVAAERAAEQKP